MTETAVSIILPVHNAGKWLDECLHSLCSQTTTVKLEVSVYNDGSTDDSEQVIERWKERLREKDISLVLSGHCSDSPKGVGCAKNQAVRQSSGSFLCFLDADDVMMPERIACQLSAAQCHPNSIVGSQFHREPEGSTLRFTAWANSLSQSQLLYQVYTSHGPTVIMPTWFCSREVFDKVGGFDEGGKGVPEDLIFFYQHLEMGGGVVRVDQDLLMYRYHPQATTFSISEVTIWKLRVEFLEKQVLSLWPKFTIWNAGKQGRRLYRALQPSSQKKVTAMCDVDGKKIAKGFYTYEESKERPKPRIPVVDFHHASPPFVICVKLDLTGGNFEKNLASLNLEEGKDYVHFN